jgi:hypothetical protein
LSVLSESPDEQFIKQVISNKVGRPEGRELKDSLDLLRRLDCVKFIPKARSNVGHDTYKITFEGRTVSSEFWSKDPIPKKIRDSLGIREAKVEERVGMSFYE